jgi:hypothetical protein
LSSDSLPGYLEAAIHEYYQARETIGKYDGYTLCSLGFLLLKKNKDESDIHEAVALFNDAHRIPGSEMISALGLWVSHARLGNRRESFSYKAEYEARKSKDFLLVLESPVEEAQFNEIKDRITVEYMTIASRYQTLITVIFAYVQAVYLKQQILMRSRSMVAASYV